MVLPSIQPDPAGGPAGVSYFTRGPPNDMPPMKQFRTVNASLWQSAVDQVVAKKNAGASPAAGLGPSTGPGFDSSMTRPDQADPDIVHANDIAQAVSEQQPVPDAPPPSPAAGI